MINGGVVEEEQLSHVGRCARATHSTMATLVGMMSGGLAALVTMRRMLALRTGQTELSPAMQGVVYASTMGVAFITYFLVRFGIGSRLEYEAKARTRSAIVSARTYTASGMSAADITKEINATPADYSTTVLMCVAIAAAAAAWVRPPAQRPQKMISSS